ncbi:uncharacterized protein MELLADRAFT_88687 [Melampsora larici-populina 98AG31]|uniref:Alpha-type protein kinase domain-containing protein n=1 Tax=Melampsora larici-populina (strain 98AG31 / pathotype 3-4-7) TaxID=747676 RepID=F4RSM1_MELLP|nr:uncharacterized protein MELLADRAFT_88687 [Melampsora larici-populina 98AG31]EGG04667.1 hypothetical protein MELLADRAFT_88687 [Melampsora larici-populina 98AG31]
MPATNYNFVTPDPEDEEEVSQEITGSDLNPALDISDPHRGASFEFSAMSIEVGQAQAVSTSFAGSLVLDGLEDSYNYANDILEQSQTIEDESDIVPYYETIEDLGRKKNGMLYRLSPKCFRDQQPHYNPLEVVPYLDDRVGYSEGQQVQVANHSLDWVVRKAYLHHRDYQIAGSYHIKYNLTWANLLSQGRSHCFERAQNSRYVAMALESFQKDLFRKRRENGNGNINPLHLQWAIVASSMSVQPLHILQSSATATTDNEPLWKIFKGATTARFHRFIHVNAFHNEPSMEPEAWPWTSLIYAFLHYTYELSGDRTLIANLDCDEHGNLSNIVCYDKETVPYHSRQSVEMAKAVDLAFSKFVDQHECNEVCEHVGSVNLK